MSDGMTAAEPASEHVVARIRRNARVLLLPVVLLLATVGAASYLFGTFRQSWQNMAVLGGAAAIVLFLVLGPYLSWLNHRYVITTRRVILRHGVFSRTRREVLHSRGYSVTLKRSPLQMLFRTGDLIIATGIDKPIVLADVPGALHVQEALHDLIERAQGQNGYVGSSY